MLQTLYEQGDVQFDFDRRKWQFKIPAADMLPANVVDLIVRELQRLPPESQVVVKLAACIASNVFTLHLLSIVYERSLEDTATDLWPALKTGLIIPTSNAYQIPLAIRPGLEPFQQWTNGANEADNDLIGTDRENDSTSNNTMPKSDVVVSYRFLHDQVQQSAMALIPDSELPKLHALIGRRLLQKMTMANQVDNYLFEICSQLNKAQNFLSSEEREQLIELNLQAGRKTLRAIAFDAAAEHFQMARNLLGDDSWKLRRSLTLDVYLANVERLVAEARFEQGILLDERVNDSR